VCVCCALQFGSRGFAKTSSFRVCTCVVVCVLRTVVSIGVFNIGHISKEALTNIGME
jgi:hypothetical protein